ncbi:uncharacterized protein M6B38_152025 [Iris pallida]|uniref:Uncharacterized protein n=1 Tax=Iris pallida TaxID=29817 RepID=A0AAX6F6T1_IRIPA|nr:uncharacterized protein M6B38_152025 [Iris pallida]
MGDVLAELENMLRSKPAKDRITAKEELVLLACKAKAIRDFTIGACASSAVVWIATKRFTHGQRFNTSVGSAMIAGMWKFNRTLNSCVDQILGLQGSRLQLELAFIILAKHQQDESRMNLVRKYFYQKKYSVTQNLIVPFLDGDIGICTSIIPHMRGPRNTKMRAVKRNLMNRREYSPLAQVEEI